jgi:hypothetical protein
VSSSDSNEPAKKVQIRGIGMTRVRRQKTVGQNPASNEVALPKASKSDLGTKKKKKTKEASNQKP